MSGTVFVMRVGVLGQLQVTDGDRVIEVGGTRLRVLVIRLALEAGRAVAIEALAQALWPDGGPADPVHALQSLISRLRRTLRHPSVVRSVRGGYCLDLPPEAVDVLRFERLVGEGRRALRGGEPRIAARRLCEGLALWRGEPLTDVADVPYAAAVAVRLRELRLSAIEDRVEAELLTGSRPTHLVAELEELTALHPLRERIRALLVRALGADGRRAEALIAYEEARRRLADELGADPGPDLREAHLGVLREGDAAPRGALAHRRGNLRVALSSFVGRAEERKRIRERLTAERLVTLIGPGGVGKSRLAAAVAAELVGDLPSGVWLVELAPVSDPGEVPRAVIGALGLRDARPFNAPPAPRDTVGRLAESLSAAETVVVLDNCEHVADAVASLVEELLGRCPLLRIVTTSREPLRIGGEVLFPVPPLSLPEPGASAGPALVSPAVRLFADRATAVRPGFVVDDDNVAAVIDICRRLDGLPLAIELAAARLRSVGTRELATRLDDRFDLLTGGSRTAPPRHRTLRAVIAWSWDLLADDERRLARRLAAFPQGSSLESAEMVAGATIDQLAALVDKSLLQFDGTRYRMLETIREYGLEELATSGEMSKVRAAHATYYLQLARRAEPHLRGDGQVPWLRTLTAEHANLLGAFHHTCDIGDAATAVGLAAALGLFWTIRGEHAEATSRLQLALSVPGEAGSEARTVATAFYLLNAVLSGIPRDEISVGWAPEPTHSVEGSHPAQALVEPALAVFRNDSAAGLAAVDRYLSHPDPWARAMLRLMRVFLQGGAGGLAAMHEHLGAAVTAFREAGERWGLAQSLTYLAYDQITLGEFDDATETLTEALRLLGELDPADGAGLQRVLLARAHIHAGSLERARTELHHILTPNVSRSSAGFLAFARITLGDLARYDGEPDEAARQYRSAAAVLNHTPSDTPLFRAMLAVAEGQLATARGELEAARRHLKYAAGLVVEVPDPPIAAGVAVAAARLRARHGAADEAAELLGAAHALGGTPDAFNPDVVSLTRELREILGECAYQSAYARGRRLDGAGALALVTDRLR
jgi:predicted ATPase/DNA-binding SARP family transcriptional activator/tetratricopeptide (TPR) repeat protein